MSQQRRRILLEAVGLMATGAVALMTVNPMIWLSAAVRVGSGWRTQEIEYRNRRDPSDRIEFQMRDLGAFGWRSRTVRVTPGVLFFDHVTPYDSLRVDTTQWNAVHEDVNELGIKRP